MWPRQQIQPEFWLIQHHWRDIQRESICSYHWLYQWCAVLPF
jgi:hypothetical protein